jgi:uncharacterized protein (TIGR03086 family)
LWAPTRSARILAEGAKVTSTLERYDVAVAGFRRRLEPLAPSDFSHPSPCDGWTAGDLVDHTIGAVTMVAGLVGDRLNDLGTLSYIERYDRATEDLRAKVADPALGATVVESPFGTLAIKQLVSSIVVHDLLVHTWDLARATDGDERLDEDLVAHTYEHMSPLDDVLREHGFAKKVDVPKGADAQTQMLCFLGRRP